MDNLNFDLPTDSSFNANPIFKALQSVQEQVYTLQKENESLRALIFKINGSKNYNPTASRKEFYDEVDAAIVFIVRDADHPISLRQIIQSFISTFGHLIPINILDEVGFVRRKVLKAYHNQLIVSTSERSETKDALYSINAKKQINN